MTRKRVTDEEYGNLSRRLSEVSRRVDEGTLPFEATMEGLQRLVEGQEAKKKKASGAFPIAVDYSMTLADMIKTGKYDQAYPDVTQEHFPVAGEGTIELKAELIHFGKTMNTVNVLKELDRREYRPATLQELLAFGAKYPEKQREFPIIALGSVWTYSGGSRIVPCLDGDDSRRRLRLDWYGRDWSGSCRFLAFRK